MSAIKIDKHNFQKEVNKRPDARLSANSLFRNVSEESIARIEKAIDKL